MSQRFQYTPTFDGLRCIAVLCVLLTHASPVFFKGGWIGVDLFFVLSGYLITSLLQNEYYASGNISFAKFYVRRALRLFPSTFSDIGKLILFRQFSSMEGFRAVTTPLVSFSGRTFLPALAYYRIYVSLPHSFTQPCLFLDTNSLFDRGI